MQLPDSTAVRQRAVGDEDLLPEDFARGLARGGLADIIGDESDVPSLESLETEGPRKPRYSSSAVEQALKAAHEVHLQMLEATRIDPRLRGPFQEARL